MMEVAQFGGVTERKTDRKEPRWIRLIVQWCLGLSVLLVPLFFLPVTTHSFELNKTLLLGLLVGVAAVVWLGGRALYRIQSPWRTSFDLLLGVYLLLYVAATVFSRDWFASVVGQSSYTHHTLTAAFLFVLWFFIAVQALRVWPDLRQRMIQAFCFAVGLTSLISLLQLLGVNIFPWPETQGEYFNPIFNSVVMLGLFLATAVPVQLVQLFSRPKKWWGIWLALSLVLETAVFVSIDINIVWYALIGILFGVVLVLGWRGGEFDSRWIIVPTMFLIVAALSVFVDASRLTGVRPVQEIVLDQTTSWQIAQTTLFKSPLVGVGPQAFDSAFSTERPDAFNNTPYWGLSFVKSGSELTQLLVTVGLLTTLVWLVMLVRFGALVWKKLRYEIDHSRWLEAVGFGLPWAMVTIVGFFYPLSFVIAFVGWFFFALGVSTFEPKNQPETISPQQSNSYFNSISFSIIAVIFVTFVFLGGKIWWADVSAHGGMKALAANDAGRAKEKFTAAINANDRRPEYFFGLGQALSLEVSQMDLNDPTQATRAQETINTIIAAGNSALALQPDDPTVYQGVAELYRPLSGILPPVEESVVRLYDKMIELEPNNPAYYVGNADALIAYAQQIETTLESETDQARREALQPQIDQAYQKAGEQYQKAADLKTDYVTALMRKAALPQLTGDRQLAITQLEELQKAYSSDTDILYELALLYRLENQSSQAKSAYVAILNQDPDHANAAFRLGEILQQEGDTESAKILFQRVYSNNPDNADVIAKLKELGVEIQ